MSAPTYVIREEFEALRRDIEARLRELTGEVDGEKAVTRHILEQSRRNGNDLTAIMSELGFIRAKVEHIGLDSVVLKTDFAHQARLYDVLVQDVRLIRTMLEERREREEGDGK